MRWKPIADREAPDWLMWPVAVLTAPVWGALVAILWLEDKKREFMGPTAEWRPWFAWHPVSVWWNDDDPKSRAIWLEWVDRRHHWNMTEYRLPGRELR